MVDKPRPIYWHDGDRRGIYRVYTMNGPVQVCVMKIYDGPDMAHHVVKLLNDAAGVSQDDDGKNPRHYGNPHQ